MRDLEPSQALLNWYDTNARDLPWRVAPAQRRNGVVPDPYHIWLSEIMLQQTTVAAVRGYFIRFITRWPSVGALATADDGDVMGEWAGLGYYARARNLLKSARIIDREMGGIFPQNHAGLIALPGIGPYTAAAISAIAYDHPETVVDGNVERVMARFFAVTETLDVAKPALWEHASSLTPKQRAGDYAQAVMDLGATVCTPKSPSCNACPWQENCRGHARGIAPDLPHRKPKQPKPTRFGIIYVVRRNDGAWLLERRPDRGLLGGMLGWPGSDWGDNPTPAPPVSADWQDPEKIVKHTFTHFHLELSVRVASVTRTTRQDVGKFINNNEFNKNDLPTVMAKAFDIAKGWLDRN